MDNYYEEISDWLLRKVDGEDLNQADDLINDESGLNGLKCYDVWGNIQGILNFSIGKIYMWR